MSARLSLVFSAAALLLAAVAVLREPQAAGAAATENCPAPVAAPLVNPIPDRAEQAAQAARILALEERVRQLEGRERHAEPGSAAPREAAEKMAKVEEAERATTVRYVELRAPSPALEVRQVAGDALAVSNHDPALTGTVQLVRALRADGTEETLTILVPPP